MLRLTCLGNNHFQRLNKNHWGVLMTPQHGGTWKERLELCLVFACDNDRFNDSYSDENFLKMLNLVEPYAEKCKWVLAPDVVGDATGTLAEFPEWYKIIAPRYPVALAAQNGMRPGDVPWDQIAALFIGGDDRFKDGLDAATLVLEAKRRKKWVHIGRVNTRRRVLMSAKLGADSIDGTHEVFEPNVAIPRLNRWMGEARAIIDGTQMMLPF
jgi:hypothetical protein